MSRAKRSRLDDALVQRGLASSRSQARALIMAGEVSLTAREGVRPTPGMAVGAEEQIELRTRPRFVSRGGEKLEHALARFSIDVTGLAALDIGASTGGFTDCLLKVGARKVYALDVGYGQLDATMRSDSRVVVMERINARNPYKLPETVDIVTADVSFISLRLVLPVAVQHLAPGGKIVALFKPQFEAERGEVGKGGVIRDPQLHATVLGRFIAWAVNHAFRIRGLTASPLLGDKGNREFLLLLEPDRERLSQV
ncbi:MAG: TlyA family RNA methyltransferase [Chloroflexi bacterium]|nr:TlyA family RNA methyltransferase [Chloroflexota bacterium]